MQFPCPYEFSGNTNYVHLLISSRKAYEVIIADMRFTRNGYVCCTFRSTNHLPSTLLP